MNDELNPWSTIWLNPRQTIRYIIETNPHHHYYLLVMLGGIGQALANLAGQGFGDMYPFNVLILMTLIAGPIGGFLSVFIESYLLYFLSRKLGGIASRNDLKVTVAWSWAPIVYTLPLWGVKYILFRQDIFTSNIEWIQAQPVLNMVFIILSFVDFIIGFLSLYILINGVIEVNKFSLIKGIGVVFLNMLIIILLLLPVILFLAPAVN